MEKNNHPGKHSRINASVLVLAACVLLPGWGAADEEILPLPCSAFPDKTDSPNPLLDLADRFIGTTGAMSFEMPDALSIESESGRVTYDSEGKRLLYEAENDSIRLRADTGSDVQTRSLSADLETKVATLEGPLSIYQGEMFSRAARGSYNWENKDMDAYDVRTKVQGLLVRSSHIEYKKDAKGANYMVIHDAYVSTDDVEEPSSWIGAGELTVYPGDYGRLTRMSVAGKDYDVPVPVLGWISFSHSLNPEEGYLPAPGTKSIWGAYLLNRYGFLLGNRRVENGIPVADYVLTTHLDYRARRGVAGGIDLKDEEMKKRFGKDGLSLYFIADDGSDITPTRKKRSHVDGKRYRLALQSMWALPSTSLFRGKQTWTAQVNTSVLSDQYVLRDFFEELSRLDNNPDNMVNVTGKSPLAQIQLWGRFAPNDYYSTGERVEFSYYRVRTALAKTRITYESNNRAALLRQYLPVEQRAAFRNELDKVRDPEVRDYYSRLLNTSAFARINSTHEFATNFHVLRFLNVTPKAGLGYSGYYDVAGVGSDNRFLGYAGCNFDIKFYKEMQDLYLPWLYAKGLTHIFRPYATISHCSISSSNPLVPKLDAWSTTLSNSSSNPMALDLMGFTSIDSWGTWTIWRVGVSNNFTTTIDDETHTLLNWNLFLDYNVENPNTLSDFSNLYSIISFRPTQLCSLSLESQTPTIKNGDGFSQYNINLRIQPFRWFEYALGYSYISNHPLITDSSQANFRTIIRLDEKHTLAGRWDWAIERKRFPIQQYGIFRKAGPWYLGATLFLRDNGGKKETGFGISFTLGETGTALPVEFF